jgi:hypothetical protein
VTDVIDNAFPTEAAAQTQEVQDQPTPEQSAVQTPGVQGQQDDATTTGLYDLSAVPDEYRSHVERIAKDIDRNVNSKLREHADYRKQWQPFEEMGLTDLGPEGIGALLEFASELADPDSARGAIERLAENVGVDFGQQQQAQEGEPDPVAELRKELDDLRAWRDSRDEREQLSQLEAQEIERLRHEYAEVEALNGKPFTEQEKSRLIQLAKRFQSDHAEPLKAAHTFLNEVVGSAETALVNDTPTPPAQAEHGGRASTAVEPADSFEEAERLFKERRSTVHA